jgi:hypothetical protein
MAAKGKRVGSGGDQPIRLPTGPITSKIVKPTVRVQSTRYVESTGSVGTTKGTNSPRYKTSSV